jgi:predicted hydrocarbon binding protein
LYVLSEAVTLALCLVDDRMLATVDALLPLSLLEAVRNVDTPNDDLDAEYVDELRNKRLGLSDTVYVQIKRHTEAVRKRQRIPQEETVALARLIGRRPDAEAVFRAAGRFLAREAYLTISPITRRMLRFVPSIIGRPLALRRARKFASRYFGGAVRRVGGFLLLDVPRPITLNTAPGSIGCAYYEAALRELLRLLVGSTGAVEHVRCSTRGEGTCEWRADWRSFDRNAAVAASA